jgi:hypothetical protein
VAELEPGDAIFIPSMWWHHVEALTPFNVLVNYWWRQSPGLHGHADECADAGPADHARTAARAARAWQEIFRHYIFEPGEDSDAHLPPHARYALAPLDEDRARALRGTLVKRINR